MLKAKNLSLLFGILFISTELLSSAALAAYYQGGYRSTSGRSQTTPKTLETTAIEVTAPATIQVRDVPLNPQPEKVRKETDRKSSINVKPIKAY